MSTLSQQRVEKPEAGTCVAFDDSGYRRNINGSDGYNDDSQISQDKEIHEREKDVRPIQAGRIVRERVKVGLVRQRGDSKSLFGARRARQEKRHCIILEF